LARYLYEHSECNVSHPQEALTDESRSMGPGLSSSAPAISPATTATRCSLDEWDERNSCDEDKPSCLHNSTKWKVLVNNKMISKDTEQDLVLAPMAY
jgi:hypothetical protein